MRNVHLYFVKGMGGTFSLFDDGIEYVQRECLAVPKTIGGGMFTFPMRDKLAAAVQNVHRVSPKDAVAIVGHSLGAVTAASVTDYTYVDLVAMYDVAGANPSPFARNTGLALDFYDVAADMVPEFRPRCVKGFELRPDGSQRLRHYKGAMGHVQCPFNREWLNILKAEIRALQK